MFDKIKYFIDMNIIGFWYSFYTNYMKGILKNAPNSTRVFNRPSNYLMGVNGGECDFTIDGYPIWIEPIDSSEFIKLVNIFPNILHMGLISPFCSELIDVEDRTKLTGYIILVPVEYFYDMKLYEFVIGHELGHISHKHLSNANGKFLYDINKEIDADKYSLIRHQDGYLNINDCISGLNKIFEICISSTIKNIPYLKKKYENKIDEVIYRFKKYNKSYKKRLEAISKLV